MCNKFKNSTIFLSLALLFTACGTEKILVGSGDIESKVAYTQKFVPGMEDAKILEYLFIGYSYVEGKEVTVDSVQFRNAMYDIRPRGGEFKIDLSKKKELSLNSEELSPKEAMLYYHIDDQVYKQKITGIEERETVYMP